MNDQPSRLLIVDDDPELLQFLLDEFSNAGHRCSACDNGQDALMKLRLETFDLAVLDWTLPDFSGVELCRRLRRSGNTTPVLMLSSSDTAFDRDRATELGANATMTKPLQQRPLNLTLDSIMS